MSSAWLLPEHIADVLPQQARQIEDLRRVLLDTARSYGYELVIPPLIEYLESLLSGTGERLDLRTFKLIDQLSGRTLGLRADATPQVARIDAHLLNRAAVTRLCYCGPVVHTQAASAGSSREPLQFGAEIYGHRGLDAELEAIELALDCARRAGWSELTLDLGDVRVFESLADRLGGPAARRDALRLALGDKDSAQMAELLAGADEAPARAMLALSGLYGGPKTLEAARAVIGDVPAASAALDDLAWLLARLQVAAPDVRLSIDLSDLGTNPYYSGTRFAIYAEGAVTSLIRGGRYDAVGAVFGRERPAVGFGLDVKLLAEATPTVRPHKAIRAPSLDEPTLRARIRELRQAGHVVLCQLPGHGDEVQEFDCDRQLVARDGAWQVEPV